MKIRNVGENMMYDIYLLKDILKTMIEEDQNKHPSSYVFEYGDGVNFVLDCLTKITNVQFGHHDED